MVEEEPKSGEFRRGEVLDIHGWIEEVMMSDDPGQRNTETDFTNIEVQQAFK